MFDRSTLLFSSVCGLKVFSYIVCSAKEVFSNAIIIYRSFIFV